MGKNFWTNFKEKISTLIESQPQTSVEKEFQNYLTEIGMDDKPKPAVKTYRKVENLRDKIKATHEFDDLINAFVHGEEAKPTANANTPKSKTEEHLLSNDEFKRLLDEFMQDEKPKAANNHTSDDHDSIDNFAKDVVYDSVFNVDPDVYSAWFNNKGKSTYKKVASLTDPGFGLPYSYRTMRKRRFNSYGKEITRYLDDFERNFLKKDPSTNLINTENDSRTGFVLKEHKKKGTSINYYYGQLKNGMRHGYGICEYGDFLNNGLFVGYFENDEFREGLDYNFTKKEFFFGHFIHKKLDGQFIVCLSNGDEGVHTYANGQYIKRLTRDTERSYDYHSTSTHKRKSYNDYYDDRDSGGVGICGNCSYFENEDGIARCRLHGGSRGVVSESSPGCRDMTY